MSGTLTAPRAAAVSWPPRLAWAALLYNVLVILWGAVVRITGAGAGCGDHWPLCNGVVVPQSPSTHTLIEFSHRLTSGASGLIGIALVVAAWRLTPRGHPARFGAVLSLGLVILEGLVGGVQVLLGLTADSTDPARGFIQGIHLANTFALLGALLLTALWASGGPRVSFRGQGAVARWSVLALALMLVLGMAGAVTALGDLLFKPADGTPIDTVRRDFAATASVIENLRLVHPLLSILGSALMVWLAGWLRRVRPGPAVDRAAIAVWSLVGVQLVVGFVNVFLKAPAYMQLTHLLLACLLWLALVALVYHALAARPGVRT